MTSPTPVSSIPANATQLLRLVENRLGWDPFDDPAVPPFRRRAVEAAKINRRVKKDPETYSWRNLALAVEYCHLKDIRIDTPMGLFFHVAEAVERANEPARIDVAEAAVAAAIAVERAHPRLDSDDWVARLTRAVGDARLETLTQWRSARGVT